MSIFNNLRKRKIGNINKYLKDNKNISDSWIYACHKFIKEGYEICLITGWIVERKIKKARNRNFKFTEFFLNQ